MPLDLPNITQYFQEREHLNQVCSALWFMFSVLDHLPSQRIQGDVERGPIFILVTSDGVRATERGHCILGIDGWGVLGVLLTSGVQRDQL